MGIGSLGTAELIVILIIVVLLFGTTRIPMLASSLGSTIRQFKKGLSGPQGQGSDGDSPNT